MQVVSGPSVNGSDSPKGTMTTNTAVTQVNTNEGQDTEMTQNEMKLRQELEALRNENLRLERLVEQRVTVKYNEPFFDEKTNTEKGGTISVYGLQRFPVSLRPSQWLKLFHESVIGAIKEECTQERLDAEQEGRETMKRNKVIRIGGVG